MSEAIFGTDSAAFSFARCALRAVACWPRWVASTYMSSMSSRFPALRELSLDGNLLEVYSQI
jgi:hypothetical protein